MDGVRTVFQWELNWNPDYSYPDLPDDVPSEDVPEHWETLTARVEPPERGIPEFRDVTVRGVTASNTSGRAWYVNGYPEQPIRDVRFEDVGVDAADVGEVRHASHWTMEDVVVRTPGGTLDCEDCLDVDRPTVRAVDD